MGLTKVRYRRRQVEVQFFEERLSGEVGLELMRIPGDSFEMGSPEGEEGHRESESPVHPVTVSTFCLGKYPVTQAQWRVVAAFPEVERALEVDPSGFKGEACPVERVSWYDTVEFCARLSQYTGRTYRLPSEAEWEYACRAGTTTPFHFGEIITTELANYDGSKSYGRGPKGEFRQETTSVDQFKVANAFGLCEMHGNVWEWCLDPWHKNYEGAPVDGSAWNKDGESDWRVVRGGSWDDDPRNCRSATRNYYDPAFRDDDFGFRVVCEMP